MRQIAGKTLACFCHQHLCHRDILEEIAKRLFADVNNLEDM
jgi:hypothetical protein